MESNIESENSKELRNRLFPKQVLCQIEFDDGNITNDFIPEQILGDMRQNPVDWFNEFKKDDSLSMMRGVKAIKVKVLGSN